MFAFTNNELRALSPENLNTLRIKAKEGESIALWKLAMCVLYKQVDSFKGESIFTYLTPSSVNKDENALLLMGYAYEHAIGTSKDYAKAIDCYSKAYDLLNRIIPSNKGALMDVGQALKELEVRYDILVKKISKVVTLKNFCQYRERKFIFPWDDATRKSIDYLLPRLSKEVEEYGELYAKAITNLKDEKQGKWEFLYQDTLLMPLEMMKALAARDKLEQYFRNNGHQVFPADLFFNNAVGRCLIDDDDALDNDYIIGGLLNMAGHEENALWQYRVGLWYEYCDNCIEPMTAAYWYGQAKKDLPAAKTALERLQSSLNYRILINAKEGTAKDCQTLVKRNLKNPQNSIGWIIESALRGDESAIQRLENDQISPKSQFSILGFQLSAEKKQLYYILLNEEISSDKKALQQWEKIAQAEKDNYLKRKTEEARKKAEAERKKRETERKAKEELIRKANEAKEAKRRAEKEAKRKAEEAKRRAEQKIKEYKNCCDGFIADIKIIEKKYNTLTDKWEEEGLTQYKLLLDSFAKSDLMFEQVLKAAAKRKWWQIPFYNSGTWTVQTCLSNEKKKQRETLDSFEENKKEIENISGKLEKCFETKGMEYNRDLLKLKLEDTQNLFKKYNKHVQDAFESIEGIKELQMEKRAIDAALMVKPKFSLNALLTKVVVPVGVILFFIWLVKLWFGA